MYLICLLKGMSSWVRSLVSESVTPKWVNYLLFSTRLCSMCPGKVKEHRRWLIKILHFAFTINIHKVYLSTYFIWIFEIWNFVQILLTQLWNYKSYMKNMNFFLNGVVLLVTGRKGPWRPSLLSYLFKLQSGKGWMSEMVITEVTWLHLSLSLISKRDTSSPPFRQSPN